MSKDLPPKEKIHQWKIDYEDVTMVEAGGDVFIYRALTYAEFDRVARSLSRDSSSIDAEDELLKLAVLWPEEFNPDEYMPGTMASLTSEVKKTSMLDDDPYRGKQVLEEWRHKVSGMRGEMQAFIFFGLSGMFTDEDLDNMTFNRLCRLVAMAEKVISMKQMAEGIEVDEPVRLNIYTPEEIAAMNARKISMAGNATVGDPIAQKLMGR